MRITVGEHAHARLRGFLDAAAIFEADGEALAAAGLAAAFPR